MKGRCLPLRENGSKRINSSVRDDTWSIIEIMNSSFRDMKSPLRGIQFREDCGGLLIRLHALFSVTDRPREWTRDGRLNRSHHGPVSIDPAVAGVAVLPDTADRYACRKNDIAKKRARRISWIPRFQKSP